MTVRDVTDLAACRAVVDLQVQVWGAKGEIVPASVLLVTVKRGGILLGAYDGSSLIGFVWSIPGVRDGQPMQWSHMLGVAPAWRGRRLGEALKRAQRERALAMGTELIEWTFDPLQAVNAHLNLHRLGAVASVYQPNLYGDMDSPLMQGTPTDRLIAEWWLTRDHVTRRLAPRASLGAVSAEVIAAPSAIIGGGDTRSEVPEAVLDLDHRRITIPVPGNFTALQQRDKDLALTWRLAVREAFSTYFLRGYRAVDFYVDRKSGAGEYLLART